MKTKTCTQCGETKDVGEFYKKKRNKDGLNHHCKSCIKAYEEANKERIKAYQKAYREANREQIKANRKAHYESNKEQIKANVKAYREANKEKIAVRDKAYREANKEQIAVRDKAYYEANKEKIAVRDKAYREANKEKIAEYRKAYREANKEKIAEYRKAYYQDNKEKIKANFRYRYNNEFLFKLKDIYRKSVRKAFISIGKKKNCSSIKVLGLETWQEFEEYLSNQFYDHPVTGEKMTFDNHGYGEDCWQIDHIIPLLTAETEEDVIRLSHYTNLQPLWEVDHLKKTYSDLKNR